jgi:hypothetical protein
MGVWTYRPAFSWPRHQLQVSLQLHAPSSLPPGKRPPVPIVQEVGWTPEPVWTTWRRENFWPYRDSNSDPSVVWSFFKHFLNLHSGGWSPNWVHSARRPLTGLLNLPRVIVRIENLVEWMAGETEVLEENLPRRHFVHHKSHLIRPGIESGPPRWEAGD